MFGKLPATCGCRGSIQLRKGANFSKIIMFYFNEEEAVAAGHAGSRSQRKQKQSGVG